MGMAVYSFAVVGAATDRLSAVKPLWEAVVPNAMADNAWRTRALLAIQRGDAETALRSARAAVDSGPIEPGNPEALGSARLLAGQLQAANQAFRVSRQMGWRNKATQDYWMKQALAAGDFGTAAMRLDAMLRQTPALAGDAALLEPFEASPRGRKALLSRLETRPLWSDAYVGGIAGLQPVQLKARALVVQGLADARQRLGCPQVGALVSALVGNGLAADGDAIWRAHCPGQGASIAGDGSFATLDPARRDSVFSWWAPPDAEVSVRIDAQGPAGQPRLVVSSSASFPREVLTRMIYLPAGRYRLSWQELIADGSGGDRIEAALGCRAGAGEPLAATVDQRSGQASATIVANGECPAQWLSFRVRPGIGELRFGNVRLDRIP